MLRVNRKVENQFNFLTNFEFVCLTSCSYRTYYVEKQKKNFFLLYNFFFLLIISLVSLAFCSDTGFVLKSNEKRKKNLKKNSFEISYLIAFLCLIGFVDKAKKVSTEEEKKTKGKSFF
jgi:predicted nucleic acid-binding Zn ribbon protein